MESANGGDLRRTGRIDGSGDDLLRPHGRGEARAAATAVRRSLPRDVPNEFAFQSGCISTLLRESEIRSLRTLVSRRSSGARLTVRNEFHARMTDPWLARWPSSAIRTRHGVPIGLPR